MLSGETMTLDPATILYSTLARISPLERSRISHHIGLAQLKTLKCHVQANKTAGARGVDIRTVTSKIEEPADAVRVEAWLDSQGSRCLELIWIFMLYLLPVR
jgi:hypothetical protein